MINVLLGLMALIVANILFGTSLAKIKKEFSKKKLLTGVFKAFCVIVGTLLMYACAFLNPDILAIELNGSLVNLETAMKVVFMAGIVYYATQDITKLQKILKIKGED